MVGFFYALKIFIIKVNVMKEEKFIQWFKRRGWKSYTFPIVVFIAITFGIFFADGGIESMIKYNDIPLLAWIGAGIAYFGFAIGMTWHMLDAFKNQRLK